MRSANGSAPRGGRSSGLNRCGSGSTRHTARHCWICPVELVWATTWEQEANEWIGPVLGLPALPVVCWPQESARPEQERGGLFWKTRTLADYAAARPFAWVDDQITMADWRWCATQYPAPTLLQPIHPARGLTAGDFATLDRWARLNQQADPAPAEGAKP